jgi:hypothetical protein
MMLEEEEEEEEEEIEEEDDYSMLNLSVMTLKFNMISMLLNVNL